MNKNFSNFIVFIDESGDPNLKNINNNFPIFTLVCCVFKVSEYKELKRRMDDLKFKFFGHDEVIFHEKNIRNTNDQFYDIFKDKNLKKKFIDELSSIIDETKFVIISSVIKKKELIIKYANPYNPYFVSLEFCLERLHLFQKKNKCNKKINIIIESRNKEDNADLKSVAEKIINEKKYNFSLYMVGKLCNNIGLQMVDLIARPISLIVLKSNQRNRTYNIIYKKFDKGKNGKIDGCGLKIFPKN